MEKQLLKMKLLYPCQINVKTKSLWSWFEENSLQPLDHGQFYRWRMPSSGDVAPCRYCVNRRFGGTYCPHLQGRNICEWGTSLSRWLQTHSGSSLVDFSPLKMEVIRSSETWVHTRCTRHHIPDDGILHSHCCENLKSYTVS
jgi:hypothetical protein